MRGNERDENEEALRKQLQEGGDERNERVKAVDTSTRRSMEGTRTREGGDGREGGEEWWKWRDNTASKAPRQSINPITSSAR